jgi:hypothetical protein
MPDVFQYASLPEPFRVQVVYILADMFTPRSQQSVPEDAFREIHGRLCREYGLVTLSESNDPRAKYGGSWLATIASFAGTASTERVLDLIEIAFDEASKRAEYTPYSHIPKLNRTEAIADLNTRFKEHGIGYQYESGEIVRVDSQFLHVEAVKPALAILAAPRFAGANAEFLKAHEHYRHGRHGEAMNECLKAFESCLKVICKGRRWAHSPNDTANALLKVVFDNGLVPSWMQSEFGSLRSTLESGIPTARNRVSGHGAGEQPRQVPDYLAAYLLHLTATAILFLVKADEAMA